MDKNEGWIRLMATIHIDEIIKILKEHPDYYKKWEQGADAAQALYISFKANKTDKVEVESDNLDGANGSMIVVDKTKDGVVQGIEVC